MKLQKITRKRTSLINPISLLTLYLGMDWIISCSFFIHTCIKFYALNIWVIYFFCNKIGVDYMARGYYFYNLPKRGFRGNFGSIFNFPGIPKPKWILKWLPLDRGYFKIYLLKKGTSSINSISLSYCIFWHGLNNFVFVFYSYMY